MGTLAKYAVVIECVGKNYSVYVPDLPGCIATGATIEEAQQEVREAIAFHIEGMQMHGEPVPPPSSLVDYVEVEVPVVAG